VLCGATGVRFSAPQCYVVSASVLLSAMLTRPGCLWVCYKQGGFVSALLGAIQWDISKNWSQCMVFD